MINYLKEKDSLEYINGQLYVNKRPFLVTEPNEKIYDVEDNRLITLFRGCLSMKNYWHPDEIMGYYVKGNN
ncbi:MAG: hypothetical protein KKD01_19630 [Proteobacteria bacterium]|nr:hypothetical protein [Pseudomonadota bacterium]